MSETLQILLVDDMGSVEGEVAKALSRISVNNKIDFRSPIDPNIPFGCSLPSGKEFDRYDLALIDLELFPTKASIYYEPGDLRGGTEVLPYLREEAPWLPVLAESRLYLKEAEHFLALAGSFGFDGHLPRDMFRKGMIDKNMWDFFMQSASDLRKRSLVGEKVWQHRQIPTIEASAEAEITLNSRTNDWKVLIEYLFCFSRRVVLNQLRGGFSGADVFKTYVRSPFEDGGSEGEWLVKVSNSPWKLHQETQAHLTMLRRGIDFARMVPLLWNDVIVHDRTAAIAYQFATNTKEASEVLEEGMSPVELCVRLNPMLKRFYRNTRKERSIIGKLVSEWGPTSEMLTRASAALSKSQVKELTKHAALKHERGALAEDVEYQRCLIHGDLHLGNIMIGSQDVLIDFARSDDGPIAIDAAKFISDLLLRMPSLRDEELPTWETPKGLSQKIFGTLQESFSFNTGDTRIFSVFLALNLAVSLQYKDITKETKTWIRSVLSKFKLEFN